MIKKINIQNKRARFEYDLIDEYTAGIVLAGTEIKSIRNGKVSISESFCEFNEKGELFTTNQYKILNTYTKTRPCRTSNNYLTNCPPLSQ